MAKASKSQKTARRNLILYKIALIAVSTFIIVLFMPRASNTSRQYELDKPWHYGQLIAEFSFPIYKTDAELKQDSDSVMKVFQPYYTLNRKQYAKACQTADSIFRKNGAGELSNYYTHVMSLLKEVYSHGIMLTKDYDALETAGCKGIRIIDKNESTPVPLNEVFSKKTAYDYILTADTVHYSSRILQKINIFKALHANLSIDEMKTNTERNELFSKLTPSSGTVQSGQQIIDRGEIVTADKYKILRALDMEMDRHAKTKTENEFSIIGQTVFVLFIMIILVSYLSLFRKDYFDHYQSGLLLFGFPILFCLLAFFMVKHSFMNVFIIPCCMVPIVIRVFMDSRTAFMFHAAMVIIISVTLRYSYDFVMLQLLTGMIAIQTLRELSQRSQIIQTAALITLCYIIFYASHELIIENAFGKSDSWMYVYFIMNGVLLLFTYPLLWLIERTLGFVSDVTLVELSNINHPILQRMSEIAPGTLQHSFMVSNLASEVAKKIDARAQLVRTAALYHDIGKIERPVFFTENQSGVSPHKHLTPQKSAEVIIAHIANGLALADKYNLPQMIKNFIASHHGNGLAKYFYITYKNEHPDETIDESLFRYPGPNPSTKEEAILMMADAVEAASRSLPEYTEESISQLVDRIVDTQVQEGYFSECDITFRDISTAKEVFKEKLKIVYHTRISYPELNNKDNEK